MAANTPVASTASARRRDDLTASIRRGAMVVPAVSLLGGAGAMLIDPRAGFLSMAVILGWTQLVGL